MGNKTITIQNMNGTMEELELINSFGIVDIDKNFVIFSRGETAGEGMSKVYISEVMEESPGVFTLVGIKDESVWEKVKQAMKEIVQG